MNKIELDAIIADAVNDTELSGAEIPAIDLYVDQIINLVAEKRKQGSLRFSEKQLTKTMINNYSKDGVITPVKGKKYTREQILQILLVYSMKSTLSIGEIKRLIAGAYSIEGFDEKSLCALYDRYTDVKVKNQEYSKQIIDTMISNNALDIENDEDYLATLGGIVALSAYLRSVARAMIDARYPEVSDTNEDSDDKSEKKKEKKEKKKEEKKEKKENKKKVKEEKKSDEE
jgi:hypothetical protein